MRITKKSVYSGLAGVGILLGAGGLAAAATGSDANPAAIVQQADPTTDPTTETPADEANETNEANEGPETPDAPPTYTSSVQTTPEAAETAESEAAEDAAEVKEEAALAALATVTPEQASAAALAAQPGTADDVELSNENGNVVYEVEVVDAKGAEFDVIIDAGNSKVLATHAEDSPEVAADYKSSIQTEPSAEDKADAALLALATVTPEKASAAALASQPGTVGDVDLSNEAGNVVYEVEIVAADGVEHEVIIDAGNASVLDTQID